MLHIFSHSESGCNTNICIYDMKLRGGSKEWGRGSLLWEEGSGDKEGKQERQILHIKESGLYLCICVSVNIIQAEGKCSWGGMGTRRSFEEVDGINMSEA